MKYRVCPYRNDPRAFARFFGEDSGGVQRFFASTAEEDAFFAADHEPPAWKPVAEVSRTVSRQAGEVLSHIATDARTFNTVAREVSVLMLQSLRAAGGLARTSLQMLKMPKPLLSR